MVVGERAKSITERMRKVLPSAFDLVKLGFRVFGLPRNAFGSIDVTERCNLRCKHCYFFNHEQPERALSADEWVALLSSWRQSRSRLAFPFFQCSWVGGEPLLRPEVIQRGRQFFRYNLVVTNGTIPLPDWPDVDFYVSIDGDEAAHEELRGKQGIHRRIKQHVAAARRERVTISCCLTRRNAHSIESLLEEWAPLASGFTFDFYTPMMGSDDPLWIPWSERDRIIDHLIALRRRYAGLRLTEASLMLMRSTCAAQVTSDCLFAKKAFAYDAAGRPKEKCMMGPKADCSRCGCIVPFYLHSIVHGRPRRPASSP